MDEFWLKFIPVIICMFLMMMKRQQKGKVLLVLWNYFEQCEHDTFCEVELLSFCFFVMPIPVISRVIEVALLSSPQKCSDVVILNVPWHFDTIKSIEINIICQVIFYKNSDSQDLYIKLWIHSKNQAVPSNRFVGNTCSFFHVLIRYILFFFEVFLYCYLSALL